VQAQQEAILHPEALRTSTLPNALERSVQFGVGVLPRSSMIERDRIGAALPEICAGFRFVSRRCIRAGGDTGRTVRVVRGTQFRMGSSCSIPQLLRSGRPLRALMNSIAPAGSRTAQARGPR